MTRKDYILLADALASAKPIPHDDFQLAADRYDQFAIDCTAIADALAENPRFDRARFLKACGVQS
jgi:hypothetical protein